jgi:O-antigen ligase
VTRRNGWERIAFVLFLLGVGCVPAIAASNIGFGLCLVATLGWRIRAVRSGEDFLGPFRRTSPLYGPIAAFVLLSIAACFFSTLPSRSLEEIKGLGTFLILPFTIAFVMDEADLKLILDVWRLTALYLILHGFVELLEGRGGLGERLSGGISHMTFSGLLMVLVLMIGCRGLAGGTPRGSRIADLAVASAGAVVLALTMTRNAYLGLLTGVLTLVLVARPRLELLVPPVLLVLYLVAPQAVRDRALSSLDPADETVRDRLAMWKAGARMIADRPLFGVGPGRVKEVYPVYRQPGFFDPHPGHLHNNLVTTAAETGIASALAYLAFVAAFFVHALRRAAAPASPAALAVTRGSLAAMAALFVAGMFEYNFGDVKMLMATLVVSALPFALAAPDRMPP